MMIDIRFYSPEDTTDETENDDHQTFGTELYVR